MFCMEMTGRIYRSFLPARNSRIVSGTKMISDTSFVTNIELKKTAKTRNRLRPAIEPIRPARRSSGLKMFSCLKPSSTVSIMNSVPSVRQSMSESSRFVGGVMHSAITAARTETVNIGSFFRNEISFDMGCPCAVLLIFLHHSTKTAPTQQFFREKPHPACYFSQCLI